MEFAPARALSDIASQWASAPPEFVLSVYIGVGGLLLIGFLFWYGSRPVRTRRTLPPLPATDAPKPPVTPTKLTPPPKRTYKHLSAEDLERIEEEELARKEIRAEIEQATAASRPQTPARPPAKVAVRNGAGPKWEACPRCESRRVEPPVPRIGLVLGGVFVMGISVWILMIPVIGFLGFFGIVGGIIAVIVGPFQTPRFSCKDCQYNWKGDST